MTAILLFKYRCFGCFGDWVLSPDGRSKVNPMGTPDSLSIIICDCETKIMVAETFKNTSEDRPFLKPRKNLSPEGKWLGTPNGVQLISLDLN